MSISVDLPQPFGPTSAVTAPRGAVKLRSATACTLPKARLTCSATIPGPSGPGALCGEAWSTGGRGGGGPSAGVLCVMGLHSHALTWSDSPSWARSGHEL